MWRRKKKIEKKFIKSKTQLENLKEHENHREDMIKLKIKHEIEILEMEKQHKIELMKLESKCVREI